MGIEEKNPRMSDRTTLSSFHLPAPGKERQYIKHGKRDICEASYPAIRLDVKAAATGISKPVTRVDPLDHRLNQHWKRWFNKSAYSNIRIETARL